MNCGIQVSCKIFGAVLTGLWLSFESPVALFATPTANLLLCSWIMANSPIASRENRAYCVVQLLAALVHHIYECWSERWWLWWNGNCFDMWWHIFVLRDQCPVNENFPLERRKSKRSEWIQHRLIGFNRWYNVLGNSFYLLFHSTFISTRPHKQKLLQICL